ncbi:MAG: type II secretion system minor pseudopilin GspI [Hyphomonadaceae bacterium]|nr:type II secretion system minor pseudopilin GspI [Hyphomonadaceae bacterium]
MALFVFALAGVALVQMQTFSLMTFARVETHALAGIVAQNRLTEAVAATAPPDLGTSAGEETMGGRTWRWRMVVSPTTEAEVRRVDVEVRDAAAPAQAVNARGFVTVEAPS